MSSGALSSGLALSEGTTLLMSPVNLLGVHGPGGSTPQLAL